METQAEPEVQTPAAPAVHENTLKAKRFAERFAGKDTEAVIIIAKNGSFALLDMQCPGKYQLTPSNPVNEQWRIALRKPALVPLVKKDEPTAAIPAEVVVHDPPIGSTDSTPPPKKKGRPPKLQSVLP